MMIKLWEGFLGSDKTKTGDEKGSGLQKKIEM